MCYMYTYIQNERNRKTDINCDHKVTEIQQLQILTVQQCLSTQTVLYGQFLYWLVNPVLI